jgi:hypothetical protein
MTSITLDGSKLHASCEDLSPGVFALSTSTLSHEQWAEANTPTIYAMLMNVAARCTNSDLPCAGPPDSTPPRFACHYIGAAHSITQGPLSAQAETDLQTGSTAVLLGCPLPPLEELLAAADYKYTSGSAVVRLHVSYANATLPFKGPSAGAADMISLSGLPILPPMVPPPAAPPPPICLPGVPCLVTRALKISQFAKEAQVDLATLRAGVHSPAFRNRDDAWGWVGDGPGIQTEGGGS